MLLYIRHADKDFRNGESNLFKHDPGITEFGVERTRKIAIKLIEMHGEPTKIIASPFRRARETALIMNSVLKTPLDEIKIDKNLSEYLGNHNNVELDVTIPTKIHNPPHPETFDSMKKRVKKHFEKIKRKIDSKQIIWFITHGIIINTIASYYGVKPSKQLPCLSCFSISESKDIVKAEFILFRGDLRHERKSNKSSQTMSFESRTDFNKVDNDFNKVDNDFNKGSEKAVNIYEINRKRRIQNLKGEPFEKVFVPLKDEYTGRDDVSGRDVSAWNMK